MIVNFLNLYYSKYPNRSEWNSKYEDHLVLLDLINLFNITSFFEIGTHIGYTANLISCVPNIKKVKTIDIIKPNQSLFPNVEFELAQEFSPKERYDMVYIDSLHTTEQVSKDFELALKLNPKIIVFHDADLPEINNFLKKQNVIYLKGNTLMALFINRTNE